MTGRPMGISDLDYEKVKRERFEDAIKRDVSQKKQFHQLLSLKQIQAEKQKWGESFRSQKSKTQANKDAMARTHLQPQLFGRRAADSVRDIAQAKSHSAYSMQPGQPGHSEQVDLPESESISSQTMGDMQRGVYINRSDINFSSMLWGEHYDRFTTRHMNRSRHESLIRDENVATDDERENGRTQDSVGSSYFMGGYLRASLRNMRDDPKHLADTLSSPPSSQAEGFREMSIESGASDRADCEKIIAEIECLIERVTLSVAPDGIQQLSIELSGGSLIGTRVSVAAKGEFIHVDVERATPQQRLLLSARKDVLALRLARKHLKLASFILR
jgi:hypothetical protein